MRLSLSVNDRHVVRASLEAQGWLSAHVNLSHGMTFDHSEDRVWINAIDVSNEPNSSHSTWDAVPLSIGDKVAIEVLPDGESDPPTGITQTSESPNNLFSDVDQARTLLAAIKICDKELWAALGRANEAEPEEEFIKIRNAVGSVLVEFDRQLISPILRRHPELLSEAQQMNLR
jgi:hypothetical protein